MKNSWKQFTPEMLKNNRITFRAQFSMIPLVACHLLNLKNQKKLRILHGLAYNKESKISLERKHQITGN
jgi:hypothetical protein